MIEQMNTLGVKSIHSPKDVASIFQLIDEHKIHLFIDGYILTGDITAWMLCKCWFNQFFYYYGVCINQEEVDPKVTEKIPFVPNARIQPGLCWSDSVKKYILSMVEKQFHPVMFYCGDGEQEKLFNIGMEVLRPGDIIAVPGFPDKFRLSMAQKYLVDDKLKRLIKTWITPNIFVGIVQ